MGHRFPPTGAIRQAWIDSHPFRASTPVEEREAEFDRWLAAHDREVAARALREAELAIPPFMGIDNLRRWLIERADRMARGER